MRMLLGSSVLLCACAGAATGADDAGLADASAVSDAAAPSPPAAPGAPRLGAGAACTATVRDECAADLYCACASHTCVPVQAPGAPCYAADECSTLLCTFSPPSPFFDCAPDAGPAGFCRED